MNKKCHKPQNIPAFTPRFYLPNSTVVGMELHVRQGNKFLSSDESLNMVIAGNNNDLIGRVKDGFIRLQELNNGPMYFSWEVSNRTSGIELIKFMEVMSSVLSLSQLEIVFDCQYSPVNMALNIDRDVIDTLSTNLVRKGLSNVHPIDSIRNQIYEWIDFFKFKKGLIIDIQESISAAHNFRSFIEEMSNNEIEIIVEDLYSKSDVSNAILMGIKYGQGYFLSRNQASEDKQKVTKKMKRDLYERRIDFFQDIAWV